MLDSIATSSFSKTTSSKMSASTSTAKASSNVVIRCGHIIPQIRLTPPDSRPAKAPEVPEQELGSNTLYVPLRTEEIGWEEGGLIWAPKRFYYPTVNLYGGEDDHIIGQYRGGPKGYRFIKITDSNFALADKDEDEVPSSSGTGSAGSSRKSKSQLPRGPVKMTTNTPAKEEESVKAEESMTIDSISYDDPMSTSVSSSASSTRQGSFSTDDGRSSGADTGATTPAISDSPVQEKGAFAEQLNDALNTALKVQSETEMSENGRHTRKLATRAGACEIPSDPVDASRLAGPLKAQLQANPLGHDRSMVLTKNEVPEKHLSFHRGKSISCLNISEEITNEYSAGWSYEQNMQNQLSDQNSLRTQLDSEIVNEGSR